jgi:protein-S-isoprenylcysteine O-methyltransferase Ste14
MASLSSPASQSTWFIALRTVVVAVLFTVFWVGALLVAHHLDGPRALPDWMVPAGLVITVTGGVLCLMCVVTFTVTGRGTPAPFDPPRQFVVSGPYRYCRNPMLLGFCIMLAGLALFLRSPASLVFAAVAALCGHLMVTLWEERHLRGKFGEAYIDYCRRVPRWIPRF